MKWEKEEKDKEKKVHFQLLLLLLLVVVTSSLKVVTKDQNSESTENVPTILYMFVNPDTLKCEIKSNKFARFDKELSIAPMLFKERKLAAYKKHVLDYPISVSKVNAIFIECNLVRNSYNNAHVYSITRI